MLFVLSTSSLSLRGHLFRVRRGAKEQMIPRTMRWPRQTFPDNLTANCSVYFLPAAVWLLFMPQNPVDGQRFLRLTSFTHRSPFHLLRSANHHLTSRSLPLLPRSCSVLRIWGNGQFHVHGDIFQHYTGTECTATARTTHRGLKLRG